MNKNNITYQTKAAAEKDIFSHLSVCNDSFLPPLNERVDIYSYAKKIAENALTFEAWDESTLIGLIAVYFNADAGKSAFITNVSVTKKFMGMGIASVLLKNCIEYSIQGNCFEIYLEVNRDNIPAIGFYKKLNFIQSGNKGDNLILKLDIKQ